MSAEQERRIYQQVLGHDHWYQGWTDVMEELVIPSVTQLEIYSYHDAALVIVDYSNSSPTICCHLMQNEESFSSFWKNLGICKNVTLFSSTAIQR